MSIFSSAFLGALKAKKDINRQDLLEIPERRNGRKSENIPDILNFFSS